MAGNSQAMVIAELYEEYEAALIRYAQRLTHDADWAEDLVQDTFVRAMGHLELLKLLKRHQRRAWLYRTLKNRFLDQQDRWRRREELQQTLAQSSEFATDGGSFHTTPDPFELVPEQYRELVHMRYILDMNSSEIGEELGIPAATVRSRLHLAMKHMRRQKFKLE